jgi:hypothetical protein
MTATTQATRYCSAAPMDPREIPCLHSSGGPPHPQCGLACACPYRMAVDSRRSWHANIGSAPRDIADRSKNNTNRERDDASPADGAPTFEGEKWLLQYEQAEQTCHTDCDTMMPLWEAQPYPMSHMVFSNS